MRRAGLAAVFLSFLTACHQEGDTIIVSPTDCGLIRSDLLGTWDVTYPAVTATTFNCSDSSFDGKLLVPPPSSPVTISFPNINVFASASNVGFFFHDGASPQLVFGNAEGDSCLMLFSLRVVASNVDPTPVYLQCLGTFDRAARIVQAACDSATILQSPLVDPPQILADCDIDPILSSRVLVH